MDTQSKWALLELTVLGLCLFSTKTDGHILVYQRITNQLIEEYNDLPAQFGPSVPPNGVKVFAVPSEPTYACSKIAKPSQDGYPKNAKFVALIERGGVEGCTFELKVRNAQDAGYDAVIVYNNEGDKLEQMSAANSTGIFIPSVFVGHTTGVNLRSFFTPEVVLVINDGLPFNINTQLLLPFSILIGLCFLIMIFYTIYKCIREERRLRRYRLPKSMLKKLPILKYTKNNDLSYDSCVICLDEFVEGDKVRVLPCKHLYHTHCIDPWLTQNRRVCPICKRKVFTKGEARPSRNRQSSLDSVTDTDDDTTPLLQSTNSSDNAAVATATAAAATASTTRHGTFRRESGAAVATDVPSDDENALLTQQSPSHNSRRFNPFDRSPNLPPHLAEQLHESRQSIFSAIRRFFRRQRPISVAAPPYLEEAVDEDVNAAMPITATVVTSGAGATGTPALDVAPVLNSSNNILNPNLSGSFKDDDELPHQSIYEPIATVTPEQPDQVNAPPQSAASSGVVAALPYTNENTIDSRRPSQTASTSHQFLV